MTTVVIGKNRAEQENSPVKETLPAPREPLKKEPAAPARPYVYRFASPVPARAHIQLRGVIFIQLVISAAAGIFVYLSLLLGSEELASAVTEVMESVLGG